MKLRNIIFFTFVLAICGATVYGIVKLSDDADKKKKKDVEIPNNEINIPSVKEDVSKEWVYDAPYSLSDQVVPYINIKSTLASSVNSEIHTLIDNWTVDYINPNFITSKYYYYQKNNILTVVLVNVTGGEEQITNYITYAFDITTNGRLTGFDILNQEYQDVDYNKKVHELIRDHAEQMLADDSITDIEREDYITQAIDKYDSEIKDKSIRVYFDQVGQVCVVVTMYNYDTEEEITITLD